MYAANKKMEKKKQIELRFRERILPPNKKWLQIDK